MIKRAETMIRELKEQMRGGNGTVAIYHLFSQDEIKRQSKTDSKIELEPGCSIGFHEHQNEEEIFYIISGQQHWTIKEICRYLILATRLLQRAVRAIA